MVKLALAICYYAPAGAPESMLLNKASSTNSLDETLGYLS